MSLDKKIKELKTVELKQWNFFQKIWGFNRPHCLFPTITMVTDILIEHGPVLYITLRWWSYNIVSYTMCTKEEVKLSKAKIIGYSK